MAKIMWFMFKQKKRGKKRKKNLDWGQSKWKQVKFQAKPKAPWQEWNFFIVGNFNPEYL